MVLHETKTSNKPKPTKYLNITHSSSVTKKTFYRQLKFLHMWNISVANLHNLGFEFFHFSSLWPCLTGSHIFFATYFDKGEGNE